MIKKYVLDIKISVVISIKASSISRGWVGGGRGRGAWGPGPYYFPQ